MMDSRKFNDIRLEQEMCLDSDDDCKSNSSVKTTANTVVLLWDMLKVSISARFHPCFSLKIVKVWESGRT